jgi:hypothetical protein
MWYFLIYYEEKTKLSVTEKILSEEIAKYVDTNDSKEEQRNDSVIAIRSQFTQK